MKFTKGIGKWKFQNENFWNLIADSDSSWKCMNAKCSSFFDIFTGSLSNIKKTNKKRKIVLLFAFFDWNWIFFHVPIRILKNELYFVYILFHEESESAIRFQKFSFWNFHFPIPLANFTVQNPSQEFWQLFFSFYNMAADRLCNNMALSYVCLLYTSPSPRDGLLSRMPSSAWKKQFS